MKQTWHMVAFTDAVADVSAGNVKTLQSDFLSEGSYPIVDQGKNLVAGYSDDDECLYRGKLPAIVFGDHTRAVKFVDFPFCVGADGVKVLRPRNPKQLDSKYLYHSLRGLQLPENGYSRHYRFLKRSHLALPPIETQRRIAQVLDRADHLQRHRRDSTAVVDDLESAIFLELFGDPVSNPRRWPRRPIGEIADVTTGNTPSRERPDYFGEHIEWIKPDNIMRSRIYATIAKEGLSEAGKKVGRVAPRHAILVTCIAGSLESIGNAALTEREVAFNQQINAMSARHDEPLFLLIQLRLAQVLVQHAASRGMKKIVPKSRFEKIELVVPPVDAQRRFVERMARIQEIRAKQDRSHALMQELADALRTRAFRGDLDR